VKTIFSKSQLGQRAYSLPKSTPEFDAIEPPAPLKRQLPLPLPEISEIDLTRHFSQLERCNMGIDTNFYPLGSCTMKLNPRVCEQVAGMAAFSRVHPMAPDDLTQGNLQIGWELLEILCKLCGMEAGSLAPNAGAHGEYTGIAMIRRYHGDSGRNEIVVPDNAHGTNPATATMAGYQVCTVRSDTTGDLDLDHLDSLLSDRTAALMLTNPSTLGLFSPQIEEIAKRVHDRGALLYYDGANLNAILNIVRPGEMGFDVMHLNLHKTFSTPHGGGGPGSGPVLCSKRLAPFLPLPRIVREANGYRRRWESENSIGMVSSFGGNFGVYLRAYLYSILHGNYGLRRVAEQAVVNANYLKEGLSRTFTLPFPQPCMHEFVLQADNYLSQGVRALDIAKRLLDYGIHPPTVYFPLIVKECLLIEPTECESKATLDRFIEVVGMIVDEIHRNPALVTGAPRTTICGRLDEVRAAREPVLKDRSVSFTD
jgi:glycine cleavage system P protein (glycine dehydrogenase) subunit 2